MRLTVEHGRLLSALTKLDSVVERRNTIPILSTALIEASRPGELCLTGTDMDMIETITTEAHVDAPGRITADARTLTDIVRRLPEGCQITLALNGARLAVTSGRASFDLPTLPVADFPLFDKPPDDGAAFTITNTDLIRLIDLTRHAISTEETRYYLNGIYLHAAENNGTRALRAVATDGHRLACVDVLLPDGAAHMPAVIVPRKTCGIIRKRLETHTGTTDIKVNAARIAFDFGPDRLISKLIDGTYPDYDRVVPKNGTTTLLAPAAELAQAAELVGTVNDGKNSGVRLEIAADKLRLSARGDKTGEAEAVLDDGIEISGSALTIGFNRRYLAEALRLIAGGRAKLEFTEDACPIRITDPDDPAAVHVLMPMRV